MRRTHTNERRIIGGTGQLLPPGPAPPPSAISTPDVILGANLLQWSRADLVTIGASFSWDDKTAGGRPWTNAVAASGPSLNSSDATLNNQPTLTFTAASSQYCDNALTLPQPATTPTFVWLIVKQNAWVINRSIIQDAGGSNRHTVNMTGTTPNITMLDTTSVNSNGGLTVGSWFRLEVGFTGSTSDYIKAGSTVTTGASAGNTASVGGRRLAANTALSAFTSFSIAEILYANIIPSAGQISQLDAYCTSRYGAGLV